MVQRDYVVMKMPVIQTEIAMDLDEFYKTLYKWFSNNGYDFQETEYKEKRDEGKNIKIKWYAEKKIDDYVKYVIETKFNIQNIEEVIVKKKDKKVKLVKCNTEIDFVAYLLKDYENVWTKSAFVKFYREFYDRFIIGSRLGKQEQELKEEVDKIVYEIKSFLNLHKFQ
jgi:hypothetical protein